MAYQIPSQSFTFDQRIKSAVTAQQWPALYFCQGQPHHSRATEPSPVPLHGLLRTLRKLRSMTLGESSQHLPQSPSMFAALAPPLSPRELAVLRLLSIGKRMQPSILVSGKKPWDVPARYPRRGKYRDTNVSATTPLSSGQRLGGDVLAIANASVSNVSSATF
jgi:hypothetical protein